MSNGHHPLPVRRVVAVLVVLTIGTAMGAFPVAAQESWKMPNLNPFKSDEPGTGAARKSTKSKAASDNSWKFWSQDSKPKAGAASQRSTWNSVSNSSSQFWNKTKSTLTPWKSTASNVRRPTTGKNQVGYNRKPEKKKSIFASWLNDDTSKRKDDEIRTVNDFLSLPKPE